jgi:hypothetical protein
MRRTYSRLPWLVLLAGLAMIATGLVGWWGEAVATPQRGAGRTRRGDRGAA